MDDFRRMSYIQVLGMTFILMCFITFSTGTVVSLEDRFSKLEIKVSQLEEKNIRLEEKVTELKARNAQMEAKINEQEAILTSLLVETNQSESSSKSILKNRHTAIQPTGKMSGILRTCRELRAADPSLPSGMQWIDPDGQSVGDDPIYVYCDMASGSTSIIHDSEFPMNVGHGADPGYYSRSINYNGSINQIKSLIELSAECHQSMKYQCNYTTFEFNNIVYAWWNDRDGNAQYFWPGNNTDGIITDKNVLPVTQLNFGRTQSETSSGIHTLGRLVCTGSVALTGLPTSCEDLWLIGHTLNGFYSVKGTSMIESVYCDFTKLPGDADFQKWIGYTDVKSAPVHFYVQRSTSFGTAYTPIPFDLAMVNEGNAMNLTSGKFTAPRSGIYFFSFTGVASFPASSSRVWLSVFLYYSGWGFIGRGHVEEANTFDNQRSPLTVQATLNMKQGEEVWLGIDGLSSGVLLYDDIGHLTHFTGFLLEEEIVASL